MKKTAGLLSAFLFVSVLPVSAATVTVEEEAGKTTTTVQQQPVSAAVVQPVQTVAVVESVRDPREVEGEIVQVNIPDSQILVRDIDGRERRITLKQGMISGYKVGDYVQVYLMADMKEAKTIHTRRVADIEGEIVTIDYGRNVIVVRETGGKDRTVLIRPGMIGEHRVGDRIKMYVAYGENDFSNVRLIRVR